jgi:DNA-binding MarR family transcriptional regulator
MSSRPPAFLRLASAVRHASQQLRSVAEVVDPDDDGFTPSHRAVVDLLATDGPLTMPELARRRGVARQHMHVLVTELLHLEYIEPRVNPAHQRSHLIELTPEGRQRRDALQRAEAQALKSLRLTLPSARLDELAGDLENFADDLRAWLDARRSADESRVKRAIRSDSHAT